MTERVRRSLEGFAEDVARWHQAVPGRVPAYHRVLDELLALLADPEGRVVEQHLTAVWRDRSFVTFYDRPLLLLAALRAEALAAGPEHPLWGAMAAEPPDAQVVTRAALIEALGPAWPGTSANLTSRYVQTNETSRAVAWLWPAQMVAAGRPICLVDLGASAGLNLVADRLPAIWRDQQGRPLPVVRAGELQIDLRLGLDRNPLDLHDQAAALWLRACVWPGEPTRQARLEAGLTAMRAAFATPHPPRVEAADAEVWPRRLEAVQPPPGGLVIAYQTIVIEYLPPDVRQRYRVGMHGWLAGQPAGRALWLELEHDGAADPLPAVIRATAKDPQGRMVELMVGRCGPHPDVVQVHDSGVAALRDLFQA